MSSEIDSSGVVVRAEVEQCPDCESRSVWTDGDVRECNDCSWSEPVSDTEREPFIEYSKNNPVATFVLIESIFVMLAAFAMMIDTSLARLVAVLGISAGMLFLLVVWASEEHEFSEDNDGQQVTAKQ